MDINERFKEMRKACKQTQEEWAEIIGITRPGVADIESGRRNVTDKHLKMLEYYSDKAINIDWIRTGEGEMFKKLTRNQELAAFINSVMEESDEVFRKRLIAAMAKLDSRDWESLEKLADLLLQNEKKES